jgi:hypothetical protein
MVRCNWHNCPDSAIVVFTDTYGAVRGLCRFHRAMAIPAAQALGLPLDLRKPPAEVPAQQPAAPQEAPHP